jgi:hypothetical protein
MTAAAPSAGPATMSDAASPDPRRERYRRTSEAMRAAQAPSPRGRARMPVRAVVAGSNRLVRGLAAEWWQISLRAGAWRDQLPDRRLDLLLLETTSAGVPGWSGAEVEELVGVAATRDLPVVLWVTGSAVDPGVLAETTAAVTAVFVADPDDAASWRTRWPHVQVTNLPPATAPTQHSPALGGPAAERPGELAVIAGGPLDVHSVAARQAMITPYLGMENVPDLHLWREPEGDPYEAELPRAARIRLVTAKLADLSRPVVDQYRVVLDAGRDAPGSTWTLLDAAAAQTCVITLPAYAATLPEDLRSAIAVADDPVRLRLEAGARVQQAELRDRESLRLHRAVLAGHTFGERARTVLSALGRPVPTSDRSVSIVAPTNRAEEIANVLANAARQEHDDAELILVLHGLDVAEADVRAMAADHGVERLQLLRADASTPLGDVLNLGVDAAGGRYLAKMDDDNHYGRHYLTDLLNAFDSTDAGIVGKWAHYVWVRSADAVILRYPSVEHRYYRLVQGGTIVARREVVDEFRFSRLPRAVDTDFLNRAWAGGVRTYSADRFNFVSVRGPDRERHTWKVHDIELMAGDGRVAFYGDPRAHVDV